MTHQRCGTTLTVPAEGAQTICTGCNTPVTIPSVGNQIQNRKSSRRRKTEHIPWGNRHEPKKNPPVFQQDLQGNIVKKISKSNTHKITTDAKIVTLKNKAAWKKLFHGFNEMYGVTYMSSPQYLLSLFDEQGFEKVELLIGHGLVEGYRQKLNGDESTVERLYDLVQEKSLVVYGTKATNHAKLYILKKEGVTRIVIGSPNLSYTAEGSRQREICVYWDVEENDIVYKKYSIKQWIILNYA